MSHKNKLAFCTNCSTELKNQENFCPNCGQENHDLKIPIGHLIYEAVESVFHFDNKFGNTAKLLLFKPGVVSKEFNDGKRARFVPPFRLYIFISFVFFFLLSVFSHPEDELLISDNLKKIDKKELKDTYIFRSEEDTSKAKKGFSSTLPINLPKEAEHMSDAELDSLLKKDGIEQSKTNRFIARKFVKLQKLRKDQLQHKFIKNTSILMFFLMPFFALLLLLFYLSKKMFYFQHLIFSIHFHSFLFIFLSLLLIIYHYSSYDGIILPFLLIFLYLTIALKNFFNQSFGKTILKSVLLSLTYLSFIGIFLFITLLVSLIY